MRTAVSLYYVLNCSAALDCSIFRNDQTRSIDQQVQMYYIILGISIFGFLFNTIWLFIDFIKKNPKLPKNRLLMNYNFFVTQCFHIFCIREYANTFSKGSEGLFNKQSFGECERHGKSYIFLRTHQTFVLLQISGIPC